MSSFGEKKAIKFSKDNCPEFLEYNQRQLSRIYPAGLRIDSSNYNPVQFWNVGCQLVALNYQTACKEMQINQGLFQHMEDVDRITFDPRGPFTQSQTLTIRILSRHQLPYKNNRSIKLDRNYQVQVRMYGVDADIQMSQTNSFKNNGYNPTWDEVLIFKVHVPHLAILSFTVVSSSFVAQYSLPFISMKQGFRRIPLLNKHSEPLPNAYLLARIDVS